MKIVADTGLLVALVNADDRHHDWAEQVVRQADLPVLTCEPVLSEAAFHLRSADPLLAMLENDDITVAFEVASHVAYLRQLALRYGDRAPDLADLCLIRMSELYPRHVVATVDESDFRVYRRNKRETIPLLCPPHR